MQSMFLEVYTNLPIRTDNSQTLHSCHKLIFLLHCKCLEKIRRHYNKYKCKCVQTT